MANGVHELVDHFFRHESGKLVASLTRVFGVHNLELVEDVVQASLLQALQTWKLGALPHNPSGWLFRVARNRGLDIIRHQGTALRLTPEATRLYEEAADGAGAVFDELYLEGEIADAQLRMMFVCCDPALPPRSRTALTLNVLCGFSHREVASAFLVSEETARKRLTRAKASLRGGKRDELDVPTGASLHERLGDVYQALYLLFNEGYNSSLPDTLIRRELCDEAARLCRLLVDEPRCAGPQTHALLALMLLHAARFDARLDAEGSIILLADQDRSRWDPRLIAAGLKHLDASARGDTASAYHLEAGIAAQHCVASSYEETDWEMILQHYDLLLELSPSPVVELNRAIVLAELRGPQAGLHAIRRIQDLDTLGDYHYLGATLGQLHLDAGDMERARAWFEHARQLTDSNSLRQLLDRKMRSTFN